jgi:peptidyl-tRNA hydrolase, PTH1 family
MSQKGRSMGEAKDKEPFEKKVNVETVRDAAPRSEEKISLIAGLGNPGRKYRDTRHNIGYMVLDLIAEKKKARFRENRYGEICELSIGGREISLFKPTMFMNLSGEPVKAMLKKLSLRPANLLVVLDDFNLALGALRLRKKGSAGGHNGLDSILSVLGTDDFQRLRVGIGPLPSGEDTVEFVLSRFEPFERDDLASMIVVAAEAVEAILLSSFDEAMTKFNGHHLTKAE